MQLNEVVARIPRARGSVLVLEGGSWVRRAFADVWHDVRVAIAFLRRIGLSARARVGVAAPNCYAWLVLDLACVAEEIVVVPFDAAAAEDFGAILADFELGALFVSGRGENCGSQRVFPLKGLLAGAVPAEAKSYRFSADDVFALRFTSGSTKTARAIEARAGSVNDSIVAVQGMFRHGPGDTILIFLPMSLLQQRYWIYSAILYDFDIVLTTAPFALNALIDRRPTVVMAVPEFYEGLKRRFREHVAESALTSTRYYLHLAIARALFWRDKKPGFAPFQAMLGGRIRYLWTGSAGSNVDTIRFYRDMGVDLFQGYGMNETCIVSKNYPGNHRIGSAGKLLPNKEVQFGADGELFVRGRFPVNVGYYRRPREDNDEVFLSDGFVRTGDLARIDRDGFLFITGRKKDLIVLSSGKKVNPVRIEERFRSVAEIVNCIVLGTDRPYLVAVIEPMRGVDAGVIRTVVDAVNKTLLPEERVFKFCLTEEPFSVENGLLTSQFKPRRNRIAERYRPALDRLY